MPDDLEELDELLASWIGAEIAVRQSNFGPGRNLNDQIDDASHHRRRVAEKLIEIGTPL